MVGEGRPCKPRGQELTIPNILWKERGVLEGVSGPCRGEDLQGVGGPRTPGAGMTH